MVRWQTSQRKAGRRGAGEGSVLTAGALCPHDVDMKDQTTKTAKQKATAKRARAARDVKMKAEWRDRRLMEYALRVACSPLGAHLYEELTPPTLPDLSKFLERCREVGALFIEGGPWGGP